jgi:hypothetical protein
MRTFDQEMKRWHALNQALDQAIEEGCLDNLDDSPQFIQLYNMVIAQGDQLTAMLEEEMARRLGREPDPTWNEPI